MVKQHYYDKLIDVFSESVKNMEELSKKGKDKLPQMDNRSKLEKTTT